MKALLFVLALACIVTLPASAAAVPYLSISDAKRYILKVDRRYMAYNPDVVGHRVSGCHRITRSRVNCHLLHRMADGSRCGQRVVASTTNAGRVKFRSGSRSCS
jgi:hypothetical protein